MYERLLPMILILASGLAWRQVLPGGIPMQQVRQVLNTLVINLLVPALIFGVFLNAHPEPALYRVPLVALVTIGACLGAGLLVFGAMLRAGRLTRAEAGAAVLAVGFGNGLGAALAVVEGLFGGTATRVPLMYEMFATVPVHWSLGVALAAWFGGAAVGWNSALVVLRMPPFWATLVALAVNASGVAVPDSVVHAFGVLGQASVPLLLFVVGSTFTFKGLSRLSVLVPVVLLRPVLGVAVCLLAARALDLDGTLLTATTIVAAAPSVAVGIAICERFKLDSALFTAALTVTTVLYVLVAPYLQGWIG
ncbi:AEC family transporter [Immundisolibacter cernigliae]|nr:AEC family transporter [Immundisolibacter cernigliae]